MALERITDKRLRAVIPKGFHYLLDYKEELAYILDAQLQADQSQIPAIERAAMERVANDNKLLEVGRKAIEDTLIEWRDGRLSMFNRGNGLVIREKDGRDSHIIRFGPETALKIGLKAIAEALKSELLGDKIEKEGKDDDR